MVLAFGETTAGKRNREKSKSLPLHTPQGWGTHGAEGRIEKSQNPHPCTHRKDGAPAFAKATAGKPAFAKATASKRRRAAALHRDALRSPAFPTGSRLAETVESPLVPIRSGLAQNARRQRSRLRRGKLARGGVGELQISDLRFQRREHPGARSAPGAPQSAQSRVTELLREGGSRGHGGVEPPHSIGARCGHPPSSAAADYGAASPRSTGLRRREAWGGWRGESIGGGVKWKGLNCGEVG